MEEEFEKILETANLVSCILFLFSLRYSEIRFNRILKGPEYLTY